MIRGKSVRYISYWKGSGFEWFSLLIFVKGSAYFPTFWYIWDCSLSKEVITVAKVDRIKPWLIWLESQEESVSIRAKIDCDSHRSSYCNVMVPNWLPLNRIKNCDFFFSHFSLFCLIQRYCADCIVQWAAVYEWNQKVYCMTQNINL